MNKPTRSAAGEPNSIIRWSQMCLDVIGQGPEVGFLQMGKGSFRDKGGVEFAANMLSVDWLGPGFIHSAHLFKIDDGRSVLIRTTYGSQRIGMCPQGLFKALDAEPYSPLDPFLNSHRIANSLVSRCSGKGDELAERLRPFVESFLVKHYDREILNLPIGRPLTGSEYHFLNGALERRQATLSFPFILPTIVSSRGTDRTDTIVDAIDRREELLPVLAHRFGVAANVIRSMAVLPAWNPKAHVGTDTQTIDADAYAQAFSMLPPELRPGTDRLDRFTEVLAWTETILRETTGNTSRPVVVEAIVEIWKRLRRRPYALPDYDEVSWLANLVDIAKSLRKPTAAMAEGTVGGKRKTFELSTWVVLYALCRHHPTDLASLGRRWQLREYLHTRQAVLSRFSPDFPIPAAYPDAYTASNGWVAQRIKTAGELVEHAVAASNCLAAYLSPLLRRRVALYALVNPAGELEGHFEVRPDKSDVPSLGQLMRLRNRKALPAMERAASEAISDFAAGNEGYFPSEIIPNRKSGKDGIALAETTISAAKASAHREAVKDLLIKAASRFSIAFPDGEPK